MNHQTTKLFLLFACVAIVFASSMTKAAKSDANPLADHDSIHIMKAPKADAIEILDETSTTATTTASPTTSIDEDGSHVVVRKRRQVIPAPDFYDSFLDYAAYDYYDWVCRGSKCQLCDVLTGDCCNPLTDPNCFMPDSCLNNPCLSGGTCIQSRTVAGQPDFVCVCKSGLTGKYCQLIDEYAVVAPAILPPPPPPPMPVTMPVDTPAYYPPPPPSQPSYQQRSSYQPPPPPSSQSYYNSPPSRNSRPSYSLPTNKPGYAGNFGSMRIPMGAGGRSKREVDFS